MFETNLQGNMALYEHEVKASEGESLPGMVNSLLRTMMLREGLRFCIVPSNFGAREEGISHCSPGCSSTVKEMNRGCGEDVPCYLPSSGSWYTPC